MDRHLARAAVVCPKYAETNMNSFIYDICCVTMAAHGHKFGLVTTSGRFCITHCSTFKLALKLVKQSFGVRVLIT